MIKRPIIIDTDPGVDDTIAILLALANPQLDIKAINPVMGNVGYGDTSQNAIRLVEKLGIDCRVGVGSSKPLFIQSKTAGAIHGEGGLAGYVLPKATRDFDGYAWDIIKEEAIKAKGDLEIITLGPLTNIAITFLRYPEIKPLIKRVVCMAGAGYMGNMNAYAEFNVWVDPD
ncbi:MAG: nucleoside hydrolase, partial [Oscillospiraceae bacterium]